MIDAQIYTNSLVQEKYKNQSIKQKAPSKWRIVCIDRCCVEKLGEQDEGYLELKPMCEQTLASKLACSIIAW
jgi:hypothetical protein